MARVLVLADRRLEADRLLRDLQHHAHLLERQLHLLGELLGRRLAAERLHEVALRAHQLVDRLDHVDGDADRARLVGDRARDRLADPPGRVGRELVAARHSNLSTAFIEADVALLDQVQELQAAVRVLLRDRDHEAQVRLDQLALRLVRALAAPRSSGRARRAPRRASCACSVSSSRASACDASSSRALRDALGVAAEARERLAAAAALARREAAPARGTRSGDSRKGCVSSRARAREPANSRASASSRP